MKREKRQILNIRFSSCSLEVLYSESDESIFWKSIFSCLNVMEIGG